MPIGFWNDPDGAKYRAAYFERFPNVWCHGDYAVHTGHGGFVILGRSDAVLNPGGVRIGTAEIYRQVEKLDEILESLAVGQDWDNDVRVVLFVRLRPGVELDAALEKQHPRHDPRQHHAAARAGAHRRGAGHPAHHQRQDRRARGAQRDPRPAGAQHRRARQSAGARALPRPARARELTRRSRMSGRGTLQHAYHESLRRHGYQPDAAQEHAVARLEDLRQRLATAHAASGGWLGRLRRVARRETPAVRGLYLWGGVGRGKTFLMDLFHAQLPVPARRHHFHRFMKDVHGRLRPAAGRREPARAGRRRTGAARRACCASTSCT